MFLSPRLPICLKRDGQNADSNTVNPDKIEQDLSSEGNYCLDLEDLAKQGLELAHFSEETKTILRTTWQILYTKVR